MKNKNKKLIKVGDTVQLISGFYKGKVGEVIKIDKEKKKVTVKKINFKFKHIKPNSENKTGEIKTFEAPVDFSNVKLN